MIHHHYEPHLLLEEEKKLIFRDILLGIKKESKEEDIEEKHQIVYNDPDAVGDPNAKPGKYKYEHEDIIDSNKSVQSKYKIVGKQENENEQRNKEQQNNEQQNNEQQNNEQLNNEQ